ncbi:hypothetical protein CW731_00530 [Polaribacter sp. ALD11]|uniref:hypothetical protein n=1 Tax=Polaribacter sp. ALD11 TaxID=2058137 RepID=UPI000C3112CC|nr:hypothetical protein [Polaribacter sp. ALD11]AUC83862.1 hypothetical protein CW731_00530 [Polaribacter sp. ALD11]
MSIFNNLSNSADNGTEATKQFVSKTYEHTKLKVFQLSALTFGMMAKLFVIGGLAFIGFIFLALSAAIALGDYLNNNALGYLSVGLFILIISLLFYLLRKSFDKKVISKMSKIFFN